ncbi:hypothetical protein Plhal304r1_c016g0058721 [Plasmopara halstedii]
MRSDASFPWTTCLSTYAAEGMETSSAVVEPFTPHQQVVTTFELLRQSSDSAIKKLAEDMQRYMVGRSDTKKLVLQTWLKNYVSPSTIFHILSPEYSVKTIVELFRKFHSLEALASRMLAYISDPLTVIKVAEMTPTGYWRIFLSHGFNNGRLIEKWYKYATMYIENNAESGLKISDVVKLISMTPHQKQTLKTFEENAAVAAHTNQMQREGPPAQKKLRTDS